MAPRGRAVGEGARRYGGIAPGRMVFPLLSAALHDPDVFSDPELFNISRDQTDNVAFGTGLHYCIGAPGVRRKRNRRRHSARCCLKSAL